MPDVTDPELVTFCNERIRGSANRLAQAYNFIRVSLDMWNANGYGSSIPNDASAIIDGAQTDGRPQITGADVHNIMTRATELTTDYEAVVNAKLNTILAVAPNPDH